MGRFWVFLRSVIVLIEGIYLRRKVFVIRCIKFDFIIGYGMNCFEKYKFVIIFEIYTV